MKEILALIMLVALATVGYGLIAGASYGQSPYGLHPLIAGLLVAIAGLAGGLAAATLNRTRPGPARGRRRRRKLIGHIRVSAAMAHALAVGIKPCPPFKALPVPDTVRDSDPAPCASARAMRQAINRHPKGHRNGLHPVPQ